jgi:hypothetical protein
VPEKTVTRSFRINEAAFLALEEEAKKHNISLNTLVNQLFLTYANFDRFFQKLGMLKISKLAYSRILKAAADKEIIDAATEVAKNSSKVVILAKYGTLSLTSLLDYLNNLSEYAYFVEYNEVVSPQGKKVITLIHNYGEKGSIFLGSFAKALFEEIDLEPKMISTDNSVTIEV